MTIQVLEQFIGRSYEVLEYPDGTPISGVAGIDFPWIISALLYVIMAYLFIKLIIRIFIGK